MNHGWLHDPTPGENIHPDDTRAGELGSGHIAFNWLPIDLTQAEQRQLRKELREKETRRGPLGFG